MHADISRAFAKIIREELRGFSGDGVTRVSEGSNWCKYLEQGSDCVSNGIVKFAFVMGLAGEEVIAVLVESGSTNAFCSDKSWRKNREVEVMEEGESVGGTVKLVIFVLVGEAVKGKGHPRRSEGGSVACGSLFVLLRKGSVAVGSSVSYGSHVESHRD